MNNKLKVIALAKNYLRGKCMLQGQFDKLYKMLVAMEQFGYASEVLLKNMEEKKGKGNSLTMKNYQELAKNIYKDDSLSSYFKFTKAINTLRAHCDLSETKDCETLGLAGAIYKYRWKFDHQPNNLLRSEGYYKRGYQTWRETFNAEHTAKTDLAYTAINYAYISELICADNLENLSEATGITDEMIARFDRATATRLEIVTAYTVNPELNNPVVQHIEIPNMWLYATLAEAFFGLRKYDQALFFIKEYLKGKYESWEVKTFMKQLYNLANLQDIELKYAKDREKDGAKEALKSFRTSEIKLRPREDCLTAFTSQSCGSTINNQEKIGICLSGGGFRAALFHIGVLAGLAEQDRLKDIEVFSCVSGGSIIGSFYYLKLRKMLMENTPEEIDAKRKKGEDPYLNIVQEIEKEFLSGVKKNLRMRLYTNPFKSFWMIFSPEYSRSYRLGELYERYFYNPLLKKENNDPIYMKDLYIQPKGTDSFTMADNWNRKYKVPQLILNATTVNTGHNWQFTASWMGEPPIYISEDFDAKPRMRRMYYDNAPEKYKQFRLGYAVAASSCVPLLFEPLVLKGVYPNVDLELVDGGVHDNQGIASILEQECDHIIVSDGSAQMANDNKSVANGASLFVRVDSIAQERVREIQLLDLKAREYTAVLQKLEIVHLKCELNQSPVSWIDCTDENRKITNTAETKTDDSLLTFGITKKIQQLLSEIRTDLDSHNSMESYSLMYSGYRQIMKNHKELCTNKNHWDFFAVADACTDPAESKKMIRVLEISKYVPFKVARIVKGVPIALLIILGLCLAWLCLDYWHNDTDLLTKQDVARTASVLLVVYLLGLIGVPAIVANPPGWLKKKGLFLIAVAFGWFVSWLYLIFLNPIYNYFGYVKNSKPKL